ncbi:MAG: MFS transporter [Chlamydiales bacterium]|nr:MFS transporter [Chlamydiales bacterium]
MRAITPAFLAIIVDSMGFGLVYPLMTELFAGEQGFHMAEGISIGMRHFYLGLSFLLYPLAAFFGASFMGDLSDMIGRKKTLLLCMGGITVSFVLMGAGVEFFRISLLLIGRALSGIMAGSQPIAQAAIIDLSTPEAKARNLTFMTLILSIGIVIGPLIGGIFSDPFIVSWFTLSTPFYLAGILGLITTLWIAAGFPETVVGKALHKRLNWMRPIHIFIEGFQNDRIRFLVFIFICMQAGFSLFFQLIQVFMSTIFGFQSWEIGLFNGYLGISFVIVVILGIKIFLKLFKVETIALASLLITGIFIILPMIYPQQLFVWIASFLVAGFDMLAYGALMTCFSSAADSENQGWAMGVFSSTMYITWAVTGFSTNLITLVGLRWLITIGGLLMLLASLLMALYKKRGSNLNFIH